MSRILRNRLLATMCGLLVATSVGSAHADDEATGPRGGSAIRLYHGSGSSIQTLAPHKMSAAELRQIRAWQQQQARLARIEAANNAGYHLSRPPAVTVPSMTSRYQYARPWFVPIYVYPRY
ncbi:MAG: hypothetical protein WD119_02045 [Pirellulaceae bacterium]